MLCQISFKSARWKSLWKMWLGLLPAWSYTVRDLALWQLYYSLAFSLAASRIGFRGTR